MSFSGPAEDRLAIRELIEAYADAVTRNDATAWIATWAEDSIWSLPDGTGAWITPRGRHAVLDVWTQAMKRFPGVFFQAWPGSVVIEGDRAELRSYTRETFRTDAGVTTVCGIYDDECVRTDGCWLFRRRVFSASATTPG